MSANLLPHLLELRRRSILILLWFAVLFTAFFFLANELFQMLVGPLLHTLSGQNDLIATQIASPVFTPLKLAADTALLLTAPYALFHLWRFVSPGLYQKEQRALRSAMVLSLLLFLTGVAFCYYLVLPFMFQFFIHALPKGVRYMPDMAYALDFITRMLLLFGLCFQVPLICLTLVRLTLLDVDTLKKIRPYVIVAAFIIGMLLTPPDVFSQIMLAVPLCLLYETGIILAVYFA
ncbi:twin-arginine translocase subunit TatC [Legionella lytica]|uniref:Sec-independent protein translocase protein TatC n=1 Tax=Legionella lytica TaxID=96232 RepID=A0ABY4Y8E0_9GAMM|nr:twin-arginine translocase subunit TatC [Legionella lytica]USQ13855.1 twin-arginine translocase subunit TatC [Legionella lytica]